MIRRFVILGTAIVLAGAAHAQAPSADKLAERLNVSQSTAAVVADVLERTEREPGFLWSAAAELSQRLTAEQKAELLAARPAVRERGPRGDVRLRRAAGVMPDFRSLAEELELTAVQRQQAADLHARHAPQLREIMQQLRAGEADPVELRRLEQELLQEAQRILTPEQQARAREMITRFQRDLRTDRRARHDPAQRRAVERRARPDTEQRRSALAERSARAERHAHRAEALNLTDEQQTRLEKLREARRQAMRERLQEAEGDRRQRRAVHARGERPMRDALAEVLTEEQRTVMQLHQVLARALGERAMP